MIAHCPLGHVSATDDYCDECGTPLTGADGPITDTNRSHRTEMVSAGTPATPELCPRCGTARPAGDRFCEGCGHDFTTMVVEVRTQWVATIEVDRSHFERTAPPELGFPAARPATTVALQTDDVLIGRRSDARGIHPDIDLTGPLDDPGVSHRHARLTRAGDGSYALTDLGSTNGTSLNDDGRPLAANVPVELGDGDRILLGAWTVIIVRPAAGTG
jgi:uncharacterized Zn finger protein (UPF0148 family)